MRLRQLLVFGCLLVSQQLSAAGFALKEQSAAYLGTAFAGTASAAIDANTSYYNPAGLVLLPNSQFTISGVYIAGNIKLYNAFARTNAGAVVTNSSTTARPLANSLIPGLAAAWRFNRCLAFGLTIGSPFGLSTKYGTDDIARYMGTVSQIKTIDISPAVGLRFNRCWSLGAGFDAMSVSANINSAFNGGLGEGYVKNKADGWVYGYHLGLMYTPNENVNMGLAYFSRFTPRVSGAPELAATPTPRATALTSSVNFPDRVVYGVTYKYSDTWTGMGEVEWTHWSRLKTFVINYNTGRFSQENLYYKNSWRFAFGVDYKWMCKTHLKGGFSFEQSPVQNTYRTARLPDSNRYWFTLGANYKFNKYITFDAAYAYIYFTSSTINEHGAGTDTKKILSGNYRSSANVVGVQLTWNIV